MRRSALVLLLLLVIAGCSSGPEGEGVTAAPAPAASSPADADPAGGDVLAFTASTVQGQPFDAAAYAGQDLMVWFWAPW